MKLVIFDDLPEGGAKRVVFEQVKGLSKKHQVTYISNELPSQFNFEKYAKVVHHFDLSLTKYRGWKRPMQELSYYTKLIPSTHAIVDLINQIKPDLVLVHPSRFSQAPLVLQYIAQPTVYFAEEWLRLVYEPELHPLPRGLAGHYELYRRRWLRQIDYRSVKAATSVMCTSRYMKTALWQAYRRRATVVPLGVDTDLFTPARGKFKRDYFLFVGEMEAINGYPLVAAVQKKMKQLFPIKYVGFSRGKFRYSDVEMVKLYQQARATLCLSINEPFGLTALESMACGTPVIALNAGGYRDTVIASKTGFMIESDVDELARVMSRLKKPIESMNRAGRDRVLRHFGWEQHILMLEKILKKVVA